jgi:tape measure domain-containing protein
LAIQLAQAYVAIVPSMKGVGQAISKAFGDASKSAGESSGMAGGKGFSSGLLKQGAIIGAASQIASKAFDVIKNSISGAVSRVDTMKNFGLTMQNLGYKSSDASKAIKLMSDRLIGLPTSLDAMAGMVQQLAPVTGSIKTATNLSLAFNDALLAGGKSTAVQENALQQYTQMLANGKPDLQSWRSMQDAMPGQLNQVAKALLGTKANSMTLYNAMQDGTVTFDQFNGKLVELDSKGTQGFASFSKQAKDATGGIGTAWTNVQTAITRSLANIITAFGSGGIADAINGFGKSISNAGNWVATFVKQVANSGALQQFGNAVQSIAKGVGAVVGPIASSVGSLFGFSGGASSAAGAGKRFASILKTVSGWLQQTGQWIQNNSQWLQPLVVLIGTAVAAFKLWQGISGVIMTTKAALTAFKAAQSASTVAQALLNVVMSANPIMLVVVALAAVTAALVYFFTQTKTGQAIWSGFMSWLQSAWTAISGFFSGLWSGIVGFFTGAANNVRNAWNAVTVWFGSIPGRISGFFSGIGAAIGGFFSSAANNVRSTWDNVVNWFKGIPGRIIGFFSNAGKWLWDAGSNIIKGLWDGLKSKFEDVKNWVSGIGDWIKEHKGPKAYDLNLLVDNGGWIMQSLATGLKQGFDATVTPYVLSRGSALQNMISTPAFPSSAPASAGRSVLSGTRVTQNNSFYSLDSNAVAREATRLAAHAIR